MALQAENTTDAAQEKHVPVVEKVAGGVKVTVGSVAHPMGEDHLIEWIELIADGGIYRRLLNPGEAPEAVFAVEADQVTARAYCNLHGLWRSS
jgi:superoxide reductase